MFIWCTIIPKYQAQEPIKCCCNSILLALVSSTCQLWGFFMSFGDQSWYRNNRVAQRGGRGGLGSAGGRIFVIFMDCRVANSEISVGKSNYSSPEVCRGAAQLNATLFCLSRHPWNSRMGWNAIFQIRNSLARKRHRLGCYNWPAKQSFSQRPLSKLKNLILSQAQCTEHLSRVLKAELWLAFPLAWCWVLCLNRPFLKCNQCCVPDLLNCKRMTVSDGAPQGSLFGTVSLY